MCADVTSLPLYFRRSVSDRSGHPKLRLHRGSVWWSFDCQRRPRQKLHLGFHCSPQPAGEGRVELASGESGGESGERTGYPLRGRGRVIPSGDCQDCLRGYFALDGGRGRYREAGQPAELCPGFHYLQGMNEELVEAHAVVVLVVCWYFNTGVCN